MMKHITAQMETFLNENKHHQRECVHVWIQC